MKGQEKRQERYDKELDEGYWRRAEEPDRADDSLSAAGPASGSEGQEAPVASSHRSLSGEHFGYSFKRTTKEEGARL